MKLNLDYNEMSMLRDLVEKKRADLVRTRLPRKFTAEQYEKLDSLIFEPHYSDGDYDDYPCLTEEHICARLRRKFGELEQSCREALGIAP